MLSNFTDWYVQKLSYYPDAAASARESFLLVAGFVLIDLATSIESFSRQQIEIRFGKL
jgi:hypothetical protein